MLDVCERLGYQYVEQGDEIVTYDEQYDKCFILLDGTIEFQIDLMDPYFQDRHLLKIAKDICVPSKKIIKEVNDYKIENELKKEQVFVHQITNLAQNRIKKIYSHAQRHVKQRHFEDDGVDDFLDRTTKIKSEAFKFGIMGSPSKAARPSQLPVIHDFDQCESDLHSQSELMDEDESGSREDEASCSYKERKLKGSGQTSMADDTGHNSPDGIKTAILSEDAKA